MSYEPPKTVPRGLKRCAVEDCRYLALTWSLYCVRHHQELSREDDAAAG